MPRSRTVRLPLEQSLGILKKDELRERYVQNMCVYYVSMMVDERGILGIRNGVIGWTKQTEGQDDKTIRVKIRSATTEYDKWFVRQMPDAPIHRDHPGAR